MSDNTKIEWCDSSWNPVTGCLHGCEYCYARRIANRFGTLFKAEILPEDEGLEFLPDEPERFYELDKPCYGVDGNGKYEPYPANFYPTFHRYRLDVPQKWKKTRTIFVCSMADLFGDWVPDEWIEQVFEACEKAPQHRYLFLTKNPRRYVALELKDKLPIKNNMWFGSTVPDPETRYFYSDFQNSFISAEPLLRVENNMQLKTDWLIIGAETGNRKEKIIPQKEWIDTLCAAAGNAPVFMKNSLLPIVGEENMRREFPWKMKNLLDIPRHTNCTNCGKCCGIIPASAEEIAAIREYISKFKINPIKRKNEWKCPFRDEKHKKCLIYPVRPVICRLYGVTKGAMRCPNGNSAEIDGSGFMPKGDFRILNFEKW